MGTAQQRRLVTGPLTGPKAATGMPVTPTDPTRRVFEHWLYMFGRNPNRCKLGPVRRGAINAALTLYDEDTLCLAIEGMAADPLADCAGDTMRDAMREVGWLLARESRVERWAEMGERLRLQAEDQAQADACRAAAPAADTPVADPAAVAAARERLRTLAARASGRADAGVGR